MLPVVVAAQQRDVAPTAVGSGQISGVVWSAGANPQPVRRVVVSVAGGTIQARSIITDDAGQFAFAGLPAGTYAVTAKKAAYLSTEFGSTKPGRPGSKVVLAAGEKRAVALTLFRGGAIAGTLRDETGRPVAGAAVSALDARAMRNPTAVLTPETMTTDDRGEYRFFGLMPGDYVIVASAIPEGEGEIAMRRAAEMDALLSSMGERQNRPMPAGGLMPTAGVPTATSTPTPTPKPRPAYVGYAPIYYPGTPMFQDGARIHIEAGDERVGVSFVVSHVPVSSIEGVISGNVSNLASVQMSITPEAPRFNTISTRGITATLPDANGVFKYGNLSPGRYRIVARARSGPPDPNAPPPGSGRGGGFAGATPPAGVAAPSNGDMLYAMVDVDVQGQDIKGVALPLQLGGTISGRVVFDVADKSLLPDDLTAIRVGVNQVGGSWSAASGNTRSGPAISSIPPVALKDDGAFEIKGIGPSRYTMTCILPADIAPFWRLRSAVVDGRDLLDTQIEGPSVDLRGVTVTLSDKRTQISGVVRSAAGQTATDLYVVAFSTDRAAWRVGARRNLSARPSTDGRFELKDLPPGEYFLAVISDLDPLDWQLPESLEPLTAGAVKVRLTEGGKLVQDLQIR